MKTLLELYKSILASVGMTVDNQGFVSTMFPGSESPKAFSVENRRLVLPTEEQLKQHDWSNRIGFHPLLQNLTGGESRVMEKFRDRMNAYADFTLGMLMLDIAKLGIQEELHKNLTPTQAAYLGPFSEADTKFAKFISDMVASKRVQKKNFEFVRFSVIKGRVWNGQKRSRVAVMHFPLYDELPKENKPTTILGHKLRISDVKMLRSMYEFLFEHIRQAGYYEVGSDSKIAPSIESLMSIYGQFVSVINNAVSILEPVISTSNALLIVDDWKSDMEDLSKYLSDIRKIPLLEGNTPSERVTAPSAPQRISETPISVAVKSVAAPDHAPTISAATIAQVESQPAQQNHQQEVQPVQNQSNEPRPRFKLGTRAPTVSGGSSAHQLPDNLGDISYSRPSPAPLQPTPPVGSIVQQQPPMQANNVLGNPGLRPGGQFQQPQAPMQPQQPQAVKVPETARLINGALYIPVEGNGVSGIPQGAVSVDGKIYVPITGVAPAAPGVGVPGVGFQGAGRFGAVGQPAITDPSQVPGLTPAEVSFYQSNPVMFQNFLAQMGQAQSQQAQSVLAQRQTATPRYLQQALTQAQQQQQFNTNRGFFNR